MKSICILISLLFLSGCGSNPERLSHAYTLNVIDIVTKKPIQGAHIECATSGITMETITDDYGVALITISALSPKVGHHIYVKTSGELSINAPGYALLIDKGFSRKSQWHYGDDRTFSLNKTIELRIDCECIEKGLLFDFGQQFAHNIKVFAKVNELELDCIYSSYFKDICYLSMNLNSQLRFNNQKTTDYDAAKYLLTSIFEIMQLSKEAFETSDYNFSFTINTEIENFSSSSSVYRPIKIKYLIPAVTASDFMNQSITRQELADQSIILINNGKVHLKFQ